MPRPAMTTIDAPRRARRATSLRRLAALLAPLLACGERPATRESDTALAARAAAASPDPSLTLQPPRRALPALAVRWARGGSEQDTVLTYPTQVVADDSHLYVLDSGRGEIVALRATDGALAWRRSTPRPPRAIALVPRGGLAVAEGDRRTISLLDPRGRLLASHTLPAESPAVRSLCALSTTHLVAATADTSHTLLDIRDGVAPRPLALPWPDLATRHFLIAQATLAGGADDSRCAIALLLGRGFALYDGSRFTTPSRYVEPFDLPDITRTRFTEGDRTVTRDQLSTDRAAARSIALTSDHLLVSFGGDTPLAARLLDVYDARSSAYVGSFTLPHRASSVAAHDRDIYILFVRHGRPAVAALSDTAPTPPVALTRR